MNGITRLISLYPFPYSKIYLAIAMRELANVFPIIDLGPMTYFLGIQVMQNRSNDTTSIPQSQYIASILQRF